jgi:ParB family chromosome partitioning protein
MKYQITRRDLIDPDENQPRRSLDQEHIQQLSESINQHGILQPLIVYVNGDRYMAVDGHYRLAASGLLALKDVPTLVLPSKPDADMLLLTQLAANNMRLDLKPTEKALGYQRLKELRGLSNAELARLMNVSKSVVTETLSYLGLPVELQASLDKGEVGGSTAYAISRAPDEATRQELIHKAMQGSLKRDEAARRVSRSDSSTPRQRSTFRLPSAEICVSADGELDFASLIGLLQALGRECRRAEKQGINVKTLERVLIDKSQTGPHGTS